MDPKNLNTVYPKHNGITERLEVSSILWEDISQMSIPTVPIKRKHGIIEMHALCGRSSWLIWFDLDFMFCVAYSFYNYEYKSGRRAFFDIFIVWNTPKIYK